MSERRYYRLLLAITLLAWGWRIILLAWSVGFASPINADDGRDEADYELFAHQLAAGLGYTLEDGAPTARRAPGTSLTILPVYLLAGRSLSAARLWFTFLSAMNCAAAAWVVRQRGGQAVALWTAAAMAVNPGVFYYALHLWSEVPYCLAITLAVGCVLRAMEFSSRGWSWCAGIAWGAALLLRPQTVFLAPCVVIGFTWLPASQRRPWFRELVREALIALALVAPWVVRNHLVIGTPTMATLVGGHTFWGAHNESTFHEDRYRGLWHQYFDDPTMTYPLHGTELEQDRQAWDNGWRCVQRHLSEVPRLVAWKVYRLITPFEETSNAAVYWAFALSWIVTAPLILVGLFGLRRQDPLLCWWILMQISAVLLSTLVFYGAARFRHSIEPFLMMAAATGLQVLILRLSGTAEWRRWKWSGAMPCRVPATSRLGEESSVLSDQPPQAG